VSGSLEVHLERQRQCEAEHEARVAKLQEQGIASLAERECDFEAACAQKQKRLETLVVKEEEIQARLKGASNLSDIDFSGASMYRARVEEANLSDAMLSRPETNLRHASLCRILEPRAVFSQVQMSAAQCVSAILTEAVLERV